MRLVRSLRPAQVAAHGFQSAESGPCAPSARASISPASTLALGAIALYQRHLSPRKGFSCAKRVLDGGPSCSAAVASAIRSHGLLRALPLIVGRFRACATAASGIKAGGRAPDANGAGEAAPVHDAADGAATPSHPSDARTAGQCIADGACVGCGLFSFFS